MNSQEISRAPSGKRTGITIFADYILHRTPQLNQNMWSAGVAIEAMPGIRITGRYFNTDAFTLGVQFSLGHVGWKLKLAMTATRSTRTTRYGIRLGAYDRNIFAAYFHSQDKFIKLNQPGHIDYQRYILFRQHTSAERSAHYN